MDEPLQIPKSVIAENSSVSRPFHEDPEWVEELADSSHFREVLKYKFTKPGDINVLESWVHKTWLKYCTKHHAHRVVVGGCWGGYCNMAWISSKMVKNLNKVKGS